MIMNDIANGSVRIELVNKHSKLIPFVGAGFSTNINPNASFENLLNEFTAEFEGSPNLLKVCGDDSARALDFVIWKFGHLARSVDSNPHECYLEGKRRLYEKVRNFLDQKHLLGLTTNDSDPVWEQHRLLALCFDEYITTNWDTALERAIVKQGRICKAIYSANGEIISESFQPTPPEQGRGQSIEVIKLHGHIAHAPQKYDSALRSMIASETDYYLRVRRSDPLDDDLIYRLASKGLLFLGYSLRDINIRYVLKQVNTVNRYFKRGEKSFWIIVEPMPDESNSDDDRLSVLYHQYLEQDANIVMCPLIEWNENDKQKWNEAKNDSTQRGEWFSTRNDKIREGWKKLFEEILNARAHNAGQQDAH